MTVSKETLTVNHIFLFIFIEIFDNNKRLFKLVVINPHFWSGPGKVWASKNWETFSSNTRSLLVFYHALNAAAS